MAGRAIKKQILRDAGEDTLTPLRDHLDPKAFREILELYEVTVRRTAEAVAAGVREGDLAAVRRNVHDLAGLCGQLGAGRAAALARRIEAACADNDERGVFTLVPELKPAVAETLAQLAGMER
jgi:HPt (histidine-containing phosphotransfer) domain-containing protein